MSAEDLYSIIDQATEILENNHFRVLTITCDKSAINQKFIRMSTDFDPAKGVAYKAKNIYAPMEEQRDIFYISDAPHLIKTVRNCFATSGEKKTRLLTKNGKNILWAHVQEMYNKDCQSQLRLCPKLTDNHITLGPFQAMKVKLASQVMSRSVALGVNAYPDASSEGRKMMQLSRESLDGIYTTVHSVIGAVKFLLSKGAKLTDKFNQDPLECHFGKHRRAIGCHENPDLLTFGYSERKFKILTPLIKGPNNGNTTNFKIKKRD